MIKVQNWNMLIAFFLKIFLPRLNVYKRHIHTEPELIFVHAKYKNILFFRKKEKRNYNHF